MSLTAGQRAAMISKAESQFEPGEAIVEVTIGALHVEDKHRRAGTRARAVTVLVTDRRVLFFRKKLGGYDTHTLRYDQIQSVDHSQGLKVGELRLGVTGRDAVRVSSIPRDDVESFATLIRDRSGPSRST